MANLVISDSQQVVLGPCNAVDRKGNPAPVQGNPVFSSSDPAIIVVTDNGDGTALAVAVGALGTATVSATADADLGDGVTPITASLDIEVQAGSATGLNMAVGAPAEQP